MSTYRYAEPIPCRVAPDQAPMVEEALVARCAYFERFEKDGEVCFLWWEYATCVAKRKPHKPFGGERRIRVLAEMEGLRTQATYNRETYQFRLFEAAGGAA
jgi:hypothetical protein